MTANEPFEPGKLPDAELGTNPPEPAPDSAPRKRNALDEVRHTRTKAAWTGLVLGALVLIVLLIFILQNLNDAPLHFLGWSAQVPVGASLLIAAILGSLITALVAGARIFQIRRAAKKNYQR